MPITIIVIIFVGIVTAELRKFLLSHLPEIKPGKKNNFSLGVADPELGYNLYEVAKIPCQSTAFIREILLGLDLHIHSYFKDFDVTKVAIENVDGEVSRGDEDIYESSEMDVEETPVQKNKGKEKESSEMDAEETPMQPSTKKTRKRKGRKGSA